jgi:hypothetical protein
MARTIERFPLNARIHRRTMYSLVHRLPDWNPRADVCCWHCEELTLEPIPHDGKLFCAGCYIVVRALREANPAWR